MQNLINHLDKDMRDAEKPSQKEVVQLENEMAALI